jgi:hypothetical protein
MDGDKDVRGGVVPKGYLFLLEDEGFLYYGNLTVKLDTVNISLSTFILPDKTNEEISDIIRKAIGERNENLR